MFRQIKGGPEPDLTVVLALIAAYPTQLHDKTMLRAMLHGLYAQNAAVDPAKDKPFS